MRKKPRKPWESLPAMSGQSVAQSYQTLDGSDSGVDRTIPIMLSVAIVAVIYFIFLR